MTSLFNRLLEVRKAVTSITKDGTNTHQGFKYASSEGVLRSIRGALDEQAVFLVPNVVNREIDSVKTKSGTHQIVVHLDVEYTWYNCEDPSDKLTVHAYTFGVDNDSKAVGKALTYLEKYFLLRFFNVPSGDMDPDAENKRENYQEPPPKKQWSGNGSISEPSEKQIKAVFAISRAIWSQADNGTIKNKLTELAAAAPDPFDGSSSKYWTKKDASWLIERLKEIQDNDKALFGGDQ